MPPGFPGPLPAGVVDTNTDSLVPDGPSVVEVEHRDVDEVEVPSCSVSNEDQNVDAAAVNPSMPQGNSSDLNSTALRPRRVRVQPEWMRSGDYVMED